jgi:hypothetical protein
MPQPTAFSSASDGIEDGAAVGVGCVCASENDRVCVGVNVHDGIRSGVGDGVTAGVGDGVSDSVEDGVSLGAACALAGDAMAMRHTRIQTRRTKCRFMCSCSAEGAWGALAALIVDQSSVHLAQHLGDNDSVKI